MIKNIIFSFLLISVSFVSFADESVYMVVRDESELIVETPALSERKTSKIRLSNGLEAFLVSDPDTPQSGAALAVNTGTWEDPYDRPGMAHFVEHMLFLGTEKYPEEEGFSRHLHEFGGKNNAFTMADRTVYMFSVNNEGFSVALDRFGQFFIAPLFNPSGVERECKAIHQEFCKDIPLDFWRMLYVKKELANVSHPFHQFCIGNLDTLAKISQDELKQWYRTHYSAHKMHLVVYSSLDLPTLEKEVSRLFSQVKSHDLPSPDIQEPIFSDLKEKLVVISPVQDLQLLELSWELPCFYGQDTQTHADKLVGHVLGHEGNSSLLALLKRENLADGLSAGTQRAGHDQCLFNLVIQLTSKGIREYETVIQRCFEAIASIQQSGIPRFIFNEVEQIETINYRYQSREEVFGQVTDWAVQMVDEPLETFPHKTLVPTLFAPEKIQALLDELSPEKCHYTLIAPPFLTKRKPTHKERWLGVDYTVVPISSQKIALWSQAKPHKNISIPRPNPFLPEDYTLKQTKSEKTLSLPKPTLVSQTDSRKIYACSDDRFHVPEIHWTFMLKTPHISDADPKSHALADLFCHAANESLNSLAYEAAMADLSYSLQPKHNGIELTLRGFNDKAADFLQIILQRLKTTQISQQQFKLYREFFKRTYQNEANENPVRQSRELLWGILFKEYAGLNEKYQALQSLSYKQMAVFTKNLWDQNYIEAMLYGNGSLEESKKIEKMISDTFETRPYPLCDHCKIEMATLPQQKDPLLLLLPTHHPANALILTADCGDFSFKRRAAQDILAKGLEEPFFSELRTKQQTAYLVANWAEEYERHLYSFFAIQSSSHDTGDLLARIEHFLESSLHQLNEKIVTKDRFEAIQRAFIHKLQNPAQNMLTMGALLNGLAFKYDGDFEWLDKRIQAFKSLTYEEFEAFSKEFLSKATQRLLVVGVNSSDSPKSNISYPSITSPKKIRSEIFYKGRDANF